MPVTYGHPTTPADILALVAARLQSRLGLSASLVFVSLHPDDWHLKFPPADRFATLRMVSGQSDPKAAAGGGRLTTCLDSTLRVAVFQRLDRDREGRAGKGLTDPAVSLLGDLTAVADALQMYEPVSPELPTQCLLREPMRLASVSLPSKGGDANPWCIAESNWKADFRLKLT